MDFNADIVVVGSGAGGASVAKELAARGKDVLLLEKGSHVQKVGTQKAALRYYDRLALRMSMEGLPVYSAVMGGGTTIVSCGNGMPVLGEELKQMGIDLSAEFVETEREINVQPIASKLIGRGSNLIMNTGNEMGLDMKPMPKYVDALKCNSCGACVLGCKRGAKWTTVDFIKKMSKSGGRVLYNTDVKSVVTKNGKAEGVDAVIGGKKVRIQAKKVVLAAGGLASPPILRKSGIESAGKSLFADLLNVTYGVVKDKAINLSKEVTMSVVSTKFLDKDGFLLSPFMFPPLVMATITPFSKMHKLFRYRNLLGIMTKCRDDNEGSVLPDGRFHKKPTRGDNAKLSKGAGIASQMLLNMGVKKRDIFTVRPSGAHPGGSNPIGKVVDNNLETRIKGLFVCDASVLPVSSGAPPIVTIVALGKRLAEHIQACH